MKILTNSNSVFGEIEKVVENSREFIYIVSPFIKSELKDQVSYDKFKNAIEIAKKKGIDINFISKQPSLDSKVNPEEELKGFTDEGCKLYLVPNLHTKVYCNESKALITSMNLYMHSIINNEEIGVKISKKRELKEFDKIIRYIFKLKLKSNKSEEIKQHTQPDLKILSDIKGKNIYYIYVLKLENDKWWIGKSKNPSTRILAHKEGMGSSWTRDNKVIGTEELLEDADLSENTLRYIKNYGWENVRGTCFNAMPERYIPKKIKDYIYKQGEDFESIFQLDCEDMETEDLIDFGEFDHELETQDHEKDKNLVVYIVKLENGKWWVGKTTNVERRLKKIRKGIGPPWTIINRMKKLEEIRKNADLKEVTLEYMQLYGWENVRGYAWSQWNMKRPPKELRGILEPWEAKKRSRNGDYLIYVLKLQNGKWFIGKTTNIQHELRDHNRGLISPFTSVNKVLKLEELIENGNFDQVVSSYAKKYGEENIRAEF